MKLLTVIPWRTSSSLLVSSSSRAPPLAPSASRQDTRSAYHLLSSSVSSLLASGPFSVMAASTASTSSAAEEPTFCAAFVTVPNMEVAKKLASGLVSSKLAACVNVIPGVTSIYEWEGKIEEDSELILMIKSRCCRTEELTEYVKKNHPYDVCEVITTPESCSVQLRSRNRPPNNTNPNSKKRKRKSSLISPPVDTVSAGMGDVTGEFQITNKMQALSPDVAVKVDEAELNQDGGMKLIGEPIDVNAVELPMNEDEEEELLLALPGGSGITSAGYMLDDVAVSEGRTSSNNGNVPPKVSTLFKGPYCPMVCLKSETLSKRLETHKNNKFACTVTGCCFETSDAGDLSDHRRTHKSKMCLRCNFSTNRGSSLKKHLANHLGSHRTGDSSTFCTMCDFVNKNPAILKHHMKNHHYHK